MLVSGHEHVLLISPASGRTEAGADSELDEVWVGPRPEHGCGDDTAGDGDVEHRAVGRVATGALEPLWVGELGGEDPQPGGGQLPGSMATRATAGSRFVSWIELDEPPQLVVGQL